MDGAFERIKRQDREHGYLGLGGAKLRSAITEADTDKKLSPFNDVITEKHAPSDPNATRNLVLKDVTIAGKRCDVYHWDQEDGQRIPNSSVHRLFVHIKE